MALPTPHPHPQAQAPLAFLFTRRKPLLRERGPWEQGHGPLMGSVNPPESCDSHPCVSQKSADEVQLPHRPSCPLTSGHVAPSPPLLV